MLSPSDRSRKRLRVEFSSDRIRAQTGSTDARPLTEEMEPQPTDTFGRSKLAAEQSLATVGLDWVSR